MKTVFLLFDSLNRAALSAYGQSSVPTPNFDRLAKKGVVFDKHYVGSLPCIPARRDMQTGRLNFQHRSWGPVEPFDNCFPELMKQAGTYTHLISDHYHYWEDGGAGYHTRYSSAEFIRGQERDLWKAMVEPPADRFREKYHAMTSEVERRKPNMVNREFIREEKDYPIHQCTDATLEFLDINGAAENWFLQVEFFDPHEPFDAPERFRQGLETGYSGPVLDWPIYDKLKLSQEERDEIQANYFALVRMCDYNLGRILDKFDELNLWEDTAIVITTDHGLLLGEHEWWGKNRMPQFDPISHIPLIVYHPSYIAKAGDRVEVLTQTIDIMPTFLDFHGVDIPSTVQGNSLTAALERGEPIRDYALFGIFGGSVNLTDGRYIYFRYPVDPERGSLYEYTLMPMHPASFFTKQEFEGASLLQAPFDFTLGYPVLKLLARSDAKRPPNQGTFTEMHTVLYDLATDPQQKRPLEDPVLEARLERALLDAMKENEAPAELLERFGLQ